MQPRCVLVVFFVMTLGAAVASGNCETCTWAAHHLSANANALQPVVIRAVKEVVCGATSSLYNECAISAEAIVPEVMTWLSKPESAQQFCSGPQICPDISMPGRSQDRAIGARHQEVKHGAICGMCEHVLRTASTDGEPMSFPELQERAFASCTMLPVSLTETCATMVEVYLPSMAPLVSRVGAWPACAAVGLCTGQLLHHSPAPALPAVVLQRLNILRHEMQLRDMNKCDLCRMTVVEVAALLNNPQIQQSILNYTKSLCDSLAGTSSSTCRTYVDIYGPAVFIMLNQYLQPDALCHNLGMCTDTSVAVSTSNPTNKDKSLFGLLIDGAHTAVGMVMRAVTNRDPPVASRKTQPLRVDVTQHVIATPSRLPEVSRGSLNTAVDSSLVDDLKQIANNQAGHNSDSSRSHAVGTHQQPWGQEPPDETPRISTDRETVLNFQTEMLIDSHRSDAGVDQSATAAAAAQDLPLYYYYYYSEYDEVDDSFDTHPQPITMLRGWQDYDDAIRSRRKARQPNLDWDLDDEYYTEYYDVGPYTCGKTGSQQLQVDVTASTDREPRLIHVADAKPQPVSHMMMNRDRPGSSALAHTVLDPSALRDHLVYAQERLQAAEDKLEAQAMAETLAESISDALAQAHDRAEEDDPFASLDDADFVLIIDKGAIDRVIQRDDARSQDKEAQLGVEVNLQRLVEAEARRLLEGPQGRTHLRGAEFLGQAQQTKPRRLLR